MIKYKYFNLILISEIIIITSLFYLDDYVWVLEGEEKVIPGTNNEYYIKNEKFTLETYDEDDPRFKDAIEKSGMVDKGYRTDLKISKVKDDAVVGSADELELDRKSTRLNSSHVAISYA